MKNQTFQQIWRAPLYLGASTLFGLLAALLGTGFWYPVAWAAMLLPLAMIIYQINRQYNKKLVNRK